MSGKTPSKKEQVEAAKAHLDHCAKVLKANEILWMDAWNAAPNPFIAINEWTSKQQRAIRKPITQAWLDAVAAYEAIRPVKEAAA